jgi:hypothetical protein
MSVPGAEVVIAATVVTADEAHAARAAEALGRALIGLALDGILGTLTTARPPDSEEAP